MSFHQSCLLQKVFGFFKKEEIHFSFLQIVVSNLFSGKRMSIRKPERKKSERERERRGRHSFSKAIYNI
jgi:hypothetical protein